MAVEPGTENLTSCDPFGPTVKGEAGEEVEPSGRPLIDTVTEPPNPF